MKLLHEAWTMLKEAAFDWINDKGAQLGAPCVAPPGDCNP